MPEAEAPALFIPYFFLLRCLGIQLCPASIQTLSVLAPSFYKEFCWAGKVAQGQ